MNLKDHRIYRHLSEPFRFMGMTKDELGLLVLGFYGFIKSSDKLLGIVLMVGVVISIFVLKRFKKQTEGFRLVSWLRWQFGFSPSGVDCFPESYRRWFK